MNGTKNTVRDGTDNNLLRDNLRTGGSTMAISDSGWPYGIRNTQEARQVVKRRRRFHPIRFVYRAAYIGSVLSLAAALIHWG